MTSIEQAGQRALHTVEKLGLALIAIATVVAIGQEVMVMVENLTVRLADLLLLFIYLEVLAMAGIYLKSGEMPVRLPLYIAIVALARYIVLDVKAMGSVELLAVSGAILIIALAILAIRFGHVRFPYAGASTNDQDQR
ncbi:MAG: phosphate-starvation-inducible PsiE family protein [Rhodospirillales bacterium]|nr:phosphate-starvation-inducible PsiE family protein [Rhodospirillales bacterium]